MPRNKKSKIEDSLLSEKRGLKGALDTVDYIQYRSDLKLKARENRNKPTPAEEKLWYEILKNRQLEGYKFNRQKPLDNYIADFYCSKLALVIEIDGNHHYNKSQKEYDDYRTFRLNALGIKVVRYSNAEVLENLEGVREDLMGVIEGMG